MTGEFTTFIQPQLDPSILEDELNQQLPGLSELEKEQIKDAIWTDLHELRVEYIFVKRDDGSLKVVRHISNAGQ